MLNDGIPPALSGISNDSASQWAAQLFTLKRNQSDKIIVSFKIESATTINFNRVELTLFNCPARMIYSPRVLIYLISSFPAIMDGDLLTLHANVTLPNISCDHLIKFCVTIMGATNKIAFIFPDEGNSDYVFLAEVTFLNILDRNNMNVMCEPPELIISTAGPSQLQDGK